MAGIKSLEKRVLIDRYGKMLWLLRKQPWHAVVWLAGVAMPPHERLWLGVFFSEYKENNTVASRGTSKSFSLASLSAPLRGLLFKNTTLTTLSASGFRGGKELFKDTDRMFHGQLKSQQSPGVFLPASVDAPKVIRKDPSMWEIPLRSHSRYNTAPTNNPDQLRGLRTNVLLIDERNTFPGEIVHKILRPMLNVGLDFRKAAAGADKNQVFQISTIDFTIRDWYPELQVAEDMQRREYAAHKARKAGDWEEYERLMEEKDGQLKTASFSFTKIDYTDLLIPLFVKTLDGEKTYRVDYPREPGIELEDILRYDEQEKRALYYTYPVDKKGLEEPLRNGTADEETWLAEQRNRFITTTGNVFSHDLIQKVSERPIPIRGKVRKRKDADEDGDTDEEFFAPVMYTCGDPCILGMDVARESDETSFVVIRLGQLAERPFSPFIEEYDEHDRQVLGKTQWNHICWAETHKHMPSNTAAEKVRELKKRYNIIRVGELRGIAMDKKGGGSAVRDDLGNPKPPVGDDGKPEDGWNFKDVLKIYDPDDDKGFSHYGAYPDSDEYWGGLKLVTATNDDNREWTFRARAMMQQKFLYIAFWMPPSRWAFEKGIIGPNGEPDKMSPEYEKWELGYTGIRRLKTQLLRIQTKLSENGSMKFVVPGKDRAKEDGKKDLYSAMIYGVGIAKEHIDAMTKEPDAPPDVQPLTLQIRGDFMRGYY